MAEKTKIPTIDKAFRLLAFTFSLVCGYVNNIRYFSPLYDITFIT